MLIFFLFCLIFKVYAQPLCTYAYSPCNPQDVNTGVCVDAPGETCYADASNTVYCCVPDPSGPATTPAPTPSPTVCPTLPPAAPAAPPPPFTGICADAMPCCSVQYCSSYPTEMRSICPRTCGYCQGAVGSSVSVSLLGCSDSVTTCKQQVSLCQQASHRDLMRWQCTYTCGYCNSCVDHGIYCATWAKNGFCTGGTGYNVDTIRSFCARTCGYCGSTTTVVATAANCVDRDASCPTWTKNGFCSSTYYTAAQKKEYCAKSCKLC